jgi:hypothetical protein
MINDSSGTGTNATSGLWGLLGGGEPSKRMTRSEVLSRLETATPDSYDGGTDCLTRDLYLMFRDHPETLALEDHELDPAFKRHATPAGLDAYEGCTGFMWGFAVNQARWLLQQEPVPNPAVFEI